MVLNTSTRKRFSHSYKDNFVPLSNRCGISQPTLFGSPTFSLAHRPMSNSDTICNNLIPLLTNIVRFGLLRIAVSLMVLNVSTRERFPHPYNNCFVSLSNRCGISPSTPLGSPTSLLAHCLMSNSDIIYNSLSPTLTDNVCFGPLCIVISLTVLNASTRTRFSHSYKDCFVPLSNRYGFSQSTLLGSPTFSLAHHPMSNSDTICNSPSPTFSLAHHPMSNSDTICNSPSPPLADIVCFDPLCIVVSLTTLNAPTRKRFPHPYNDCFISLSSRCEISHQHGSFQHVLSVRIDISR